MTEMEHNGGETVEIRKSEKPNNGLIKVWIVCILTFFAVLSTCISPTANASSDRNFVAPETLEELRAANPEDIAGLARYDGRDYGIVTSLKSQSPYNLCWCFAAIAAMETNILRKGFTVKEELDLDELSLAYAIFGDGWNSGAYSNNVGPITSHWVGLNNEGTGLGYTGQGNSGYIVTRSITVGGTMRSIKRAVSTYGAVTVSLMSGGLGANQHDGEDYFYTSSMSYDHDVTIVGWDDTVDKSLFGNPNVKQDGAWIIKNSWRSYHYVSYDVNLSNPYTYECDRKDNYSRNYAQDSVAIGDNQLGYIYYGNEKQYMNKGGSVFKAEQPTMGTTQVLKAVNMLLQTAGEETFCTVDIYTDVDFTAKDPTVGTLRSTTVYEPKYSGYHTVSIEEPIPIEAGEYFSVVVTTNGSLYVDKLAERGEDFGSYYWNGSDWLLYENISQAGKFSALRLKAWTYDVPLNYGAIKTELDGATVSFSESEFVYNGTERRPEPTVSLDGKILKPNEEYTVSYQNNLHAGTATVTVRGTGYYSGEATAEFTIKKAPNPYNMPEPHSTIIVPYGKNLPVVLPDGWSFPSDAASSYAYALLTAGASIDATMLYTADDASDFETSSVVVKLVRGKISNTSISLASSTVTVVNPTYDGRVPKPEVTVKKGDNVLVENVDYVVIYSRNSAVGNYSLTVCGNGNYSDSKIVNYRINPAVAPKPADSFTVEWDTDIRNVNWGSGWSLKNGNISVEAGSSETVVLEFFDKENYTQTEATAIVYRNAAPPVELKSLNDCEITLDKTEFDYSGFALKPAVTVRDGGYTLVNGVDYVLYFENNVKGGTAKLTVEGIVNYKDCAELSYTINPPACYHDGEFSTTVVPPTCTADGYTRYACSLCGEYYYDADKIWSIAHNYETRFDTRNHWKECKMCGDKTDITAHTAGAEATETTPQTCTACGYVITPPLGHTHSLSLVPAVNATCTENGHIAYYVCNGCDKLFGDSAGESEITLAETVTAKLSHDFTEMRSDAEYHWHICAVCGTADTKTQHVPGAEATETAPQTCTACGYVIHPALEHVHSLSLVAAVNATCTENGHSAYYVCNGCDKLFGDSAGESEITLAETVTAKLSHDFTEMRSDAEYHWHICAVCGTADTKALHVPGAEATETAPQTCTVCGYVIHPVLEHVHSLSLVPAVNATCTEAGHTEYYSCRCGKLFADDGAEREITENDTAVPAKGHTSGDVLRENVVNATCAAKGSYDEVTKCVDCNAELGRVRKITEKIPHDFQNGVCSVCGTVDGSVTDAEQPAPPKKKTDDSVVIAIIVITLLVVAAIITVTVFVSRRKKR